MDQERGGGARVDGSAPTLASDKSEAAKTQHNPNSSKIAGPLAPAAAAAAQQAGESAASTAEASMPAEIPVSGGEGQHGATVAATALHAVAEGRRLPPPHSQRQETNDRTSDDGACKTSSPQKAVHPLAGAALRGGPNDPGGVGVQCSDDQVQRLAEREVSHHLQRAHSQSKVAGAGSLTRHAPTSSTASYPQQQPQSQPHPLHHPKIAKKKGRFSIVDDVSAQSAPALGAVPVPPSDVSATGSNFVLKSTASVSLRSSATPSPPTVAAAADGAGFSASNAQFQTSATTILDKTSRDDVSDVTVPASHAGRPEINPSVVPDNNRRGLSNGYQAVPGPPYGNETPSPPIVISVASSVAGGAGSGARHVSTEMSQISSSDRNVAAAPTSGAISMPQVQKKGRFVVSNSASHTSGEPSASASGGLGITAAVGLLPGEKGLTPVSVVAIPPIPPSTVVELNEAAQLQMERANQTTFVVDQQGDARGSAGRHGGGGGPQIHVQGAISGKPWTTDHFKTPAVVDAIQPPPGGAVSGKTKLAHSSSHPPETRTTPSALDLKGGVGGFGKVLYFLDQMKLEVTEADKSNRSLLKDMKFLRDKNKELEARSRDLEKRLFEEKHLRETAEGKVRNLKKRINEMKKNDAMTTTAPNVEGYSTEQDGSQNTAADPTSVEPSNTYPHTDDGKSDYLARPVVTDACNSDERIGSSHKTPDPNINRSSADRTIDAPSISAAKSMKRGSNARPPLPASQPRHRNDSHVSSANSHGVVDPVRISQHELAPQIKANVADTNSTLVPETATTLQRAGNQGAVGKHPVGVPLGTHGRHQPDPLAAAHPAHRTGQHDQKVEGQQALSMSGDSTLPLKNNQTMANFPFNPLLPTREGPPIYSDQAMCDTNKEDGGSGSAYSPAVRNGGAVAPVPAHCMAHNFDPLTSSSQSSLRRKQQMASPNVTASGVVLHNRKPNEFDPLRPSQVTSGKGDDEVNAPIRDDTSLGNVRCLSRDTGEPETSALVAGNDSTTPQENPSNVTFVKAAAPTFDPAIVDTLETQHQCHPLPNPNASGTGADGKSSRSNTAVADCADFSHMHEQPVERFATPSSWVQSETPPNHPVHRHPCHQQHAQGQIIQEQHHRQASDPFDELAVRRATAQNQPHAQHNVGNASNNMWSNSFQ